MKKIFVFLGLLLVVALFGACGATVEGITISSEGNVRTVAAGETLQLYAKVFPEKASQEVDWASSDETLATVDAKGLVTALLKGEVSITATSKANDKIKQTFSLIIEEGTPFYDVYGPGKGEELLPGEEEDREIYHRTLTYLSRHGYERYELSNYAKPGFECKHNLGYWSGKNYVGFGLGAASMVEGVRWKNTSSMEAYLAGEAKREDEHRLTLQERMEEYMFLGLRKTKGVSVSGFFELFGTDMDVIYGPWIEKMKKNDLLCGTKYLALTTRGQDLANYVMAGFLQD